jgi:putative ABC transport system permease protein
MTAFLRRISRRLRALASGRAIDRELDEEMRLHVDMEAADLARSRGLAPDEAHRHAMLAFGGVDRYAEEHRDARGVRWLEEFGQDVRYSMRGLLRSPGFTLSAVLVLALGIGASTAVFSAVDAVLISKLPYHEDERLVRIYEQNAPSNMWTLSVVDYQAVVEQSRTLSAVGAMRLRRSPVSVAGEPVRENTIGITSGVLRALGVRPVRGRGIEPADERLGAPLVVVLGHVFATQHFGSDAAAIGKSILLDGVDHTVIGVLPPDVDRLAHVTAQVWPVYQMRPPTRRGPFGLHVIGRLAPGVTMEQSKRELAGISERIFPIWAAGFQDKNAKLTPYMLRTTIIGDAGKTLGLVAAAVALVLLIGVANVASLVLVRASGRARELALRTVLGATRVRLARQLVTESVVLALLGALAGLVLGSLMLTTLSAIATNVARIGDARLDARAIGFGTAVALIAAIAVGAYPVIGLLRRDPAPAIHGGDRTIGAGKGTQITRGAFVVAQFAFALPLLAGAGLLLNSFLRLQQVDPGFDTERLLASRVSLPVGGYSEDSATRIFWSRALPLIKQIPGVADAGFSTAAPPFDPGVDENNFDLIDRPVPPGGSQPVSPWVVATPDFFTTLGIKHVAGRTFTPSDTGGVPVVVVSESWARHYFPDGTAIGRRLISGGCTTCTPTVVVGIVSDVRYQGLDGTADAVYSPASEGWPRNASLFVRANGSTTGLGERVRSVLRSLDPGVPLDEVEAMNDRVYASVTEPRHWTTIIGAFAATALTLAAIGVFGMLSYAVSARRREIGVRMALGARGTNVVGMIVRRGMGLAAAGAVLGLLVTVAGARWLRDVLFDVGARDPMTIGAVTLLLLTVALGASWLPARRAALIDPAEAMRAD